MPFNRLQQIIAERKAAANKEEVIEDASTPQEDRTRGETRREAKEDRKEDRKEKVEQKRNYRLEKINAVKEKIYAVASKRKWLFFIIVGAIVAYLVIFKGGFGGGDILTKIKGFFG
ncbi:hemolysin XhlA family protein [Ulvibacter sp.]|mgnify:FL=1|nr:hemolysin XhlA family protein [Ulvibacter sp.]